MNGSTYQDFCPRAYEKELKEAKAHYNYAIKNGYQLNEEPTDEEILDYWRRSL